MKLVFIYGLPAVGKMSVAKYLSRKAGFKFFHLHHTIDYVRKIFPRDVKNSELLIDKFCLEMITLAVKDDIDMVFTYVYANPDDNDFIRKIKAICSTHGVDLYFVQLKCDWSRNLLRVNGKERHEFHKITSKKLLRSLKKKYNLESQIKFKNSIIIDNTDKPAAKVALTIIDKFNL